MGMRLAQTNKQTNYGAFRHQQPPERNIGEMPRLASVEKTSRSDPGMGGRQHLLNMCCIPCGKMYATSLVDVQLIKHLP